MRLLILAGVLILVAPAHAVTLLQEGFDTASALDAEIFDTREARCALSRGRLVLYYSSSQKDPASGLRCRLLSVKSPPDIREMDFRFAGGGSEMSNSMFIAYAVGSGRGLCLPSLPEANVRNDRSGYIVRYIRHGDGTNEIKVYRNDEGWDRELHHEALPANPLTALQRVLIRHGRDGVHEITTSLGGGFEKTIVVRDATYPPGNDRPNIQWAAKGHSHVGAVIDIAMDTWAVRDIPFDRARERSRAPAAQDGGMAGEPIDPDALEALAVSEMNHGEWSDARRHFESALRLDAGVPGVRRARVRSLLAGVYASRDTDEAARLYDQALTDARQHAGTGHPEVARILGRLGNFQMSQKQFKSAEKSFQEAVRVFKHAGAAHDWDRAEILRQLAVLYQQHLRRTSDARSALLAGLPVWEKAETQPLASADAFYRLAETYRVDNQFASAETWYLRALAIQERFVDSEPTVSVNTLHHLAQVDRLLGRHLASEAYFKRVVSILEKTMGRNHPQLAVARTNFANLYVDLKRYAEAEVLYKEALAILERDVGQNHFLVAKVFDRLADLYLRMNRPADAKKYEDMSRGARSGTPATK